MSREKARTTGDWDDDEYYSSGESHTPAPRRRRRKQRSVWPWLLLGCAGGIIILVLSAVIIVLLAVRSATNGGSAPIIPGIPNQSTYSKQSQQTLPISSLTMLQVHNQVGNVTITADRTATSATLTTVKNAKAASSDDANKEFTNISVHIQVPTATSLSITATVPDTGSIFGSHNDSVDMNIILPTSVLTHSSNATLITNSSTTTSTAGTPFTLTVDNSIGNVAVSGINGILLLKDDVGNITVDHTTLFDTSHLLTGTGKVTFNGDLDTTPLTGGSTPRYKLQSETGTVEATLPGSTNVILDANTNYGTITSDFPINITTSDKSANFYGPLNANSPSGPAVAVLTLNVSTGDVLVHKA